MWPIFCPQMQNSAGTVLQFELYPPLFTYNVGFYASRKVNIVERWVSVPAVQLLFGSALTISFGLACSRGGWSHFFRLRLRSCSKMFDSGSGLAILQIWESDSCSDSGYNHRSSRNLPMFLRNDHAESCYCRNWKLTPDPGLVFPKFLTPGSNEKRRILP